MSRFKFLRMFRREPKFGEKTVTDRVVGLLTVRGLRQRVASAWNAFFEFHAPGWALVAKRVYTPAEVPKWYDYFNPIYWFIWIPGFAYQWLVSRPYTSLGPAFVAGVALVAVVTLVIQQRYDHKQSQLSFYQTTLENAYRNDDNKLARIALLSLIRRSPDSERYQYLQALLDYKMDRKAEASQAMLRLALNNKHWEAANWLLTQQFKMDEVDKWQPAENATFLQLYAIAAQGAKGQAEVALKLLMANYQIKKGAASDAAATLSTLAASNPDLHLTTAILYYQLGNAAAADKQAEQAERHYTSRLAENPSDVAIRFNLAKALVLRRLEQQAVQTLSDGFRLTEDKRFLEAGGEALVAWSNRIAKDEPNSPQSLTQRMELLIRATQIAPANEIVSEALTQMAIDCAENSNQQVTSLRQALLRGVSPSNLHFINGTVELLRGDIEKAEMHLQLAAQENANLPGLLNNMAVALYQRDSPQLDKALTLANAALEKLPNHEYIRETRGQILIRLKRYEEAIGDLEYALKVPALAKNVHVALATAYEGIGQKDLAQSHRLMAEGVSE